jgi:hypothetical protein
MGFLDKLKEGAESVKEASSAAAAKGKVQMKIMQTKRDLAAAYGEFGEKAFELVDSGAISHEQLTPGAEKIRSLKAEIEQLEAEEGSPTDGDGAAAESEPAATPPAATP